jgi:hypothetical protein
MFSRPFRLFTIGLFTRWGSMIPPLVRYGINGEMSPRMRPLYQQRLWDHSSSLFRVFVRLYTRDVRSYFCLCNNMCIYIYIYITWRWTWYVIFTDSAECQLWYVKYFLFNCRWYTKATEEWLKCSAFTNQKYIGLPRAAAYAGRSLAGRCVLSFGFKKSFSDPATRDIQKFSWLAV